MQEVIITQKIKVDDCIAQEIVWLNSCGVRTEGCCCGHGKFNPEAMIKPSSKKRAIELGYEPIYNPERGISETGGRGIFLVSLKSQCKCKK